MNVKVMREDIKSPLDASDEPFKSKPKAMDLEAQINQLENELTVGPFHAHQPDLIHESFPHQVVQMEELIEPSASSHDISQDYSG